MCLMVQMLKLTSNILNNASTQNFYMKFLHWLSNRKLHSHLYLLSQFLR